MISLPELQRPETTGHLTEQTALACYLSAVVAMGNCMAEVCPPVGTMYRDRMLKLPRRLGFDTTPQALQHSREAVETDLLEYSSAAGAWVQQVSAHATTILAHLRDTEDNLAAAAELQLAFLDDLAEHMEAAAQVDDEADLRRSFTRYAAGLRAYSRRSRAEELATVDEFQKRREEIVAWRGEATGSIFTDPESGLLNRAAAERRIKTEILKQKPFCVIVVRWSEEESEQESKTAAAQITKELADRLAATIRPYDLIFHWSRNQLVTIFEAPEANIASRAKQIAGWLGEPLFPVEIEGQTSAVRTRTQISVLEYVDGETAGALIKRIEAEARQEVAV